MKHWKIIGSLAVLAASAAGAAVAIRIKQKREKETIDLEHCCPEEVCPDVDMNGDPACFRMASKARVPDEAPVEDDDFFPAFPNGPVEEVIASAVPDIKVADELEPIEELVSVEPTEEELKSE